MRDLWSAWPQLERQLSKCRSKVLLLDFDGTLVPIVSHPDRVHLDPATLKVLKKLTRQPLMHVVLITGRSLKDLRRHIRLNAIYFGNHGLEIRGARFVLPLKAKRAIGFKRVIQALAGELKTVFKGLPGVIVEDKGYTLSLHYRRVTRRNLKLFQRKAHLIRRTFKGPVVWRTGKKLWDIRPSLNWGKGDAAKLILKRFPGALPIVIGDDDTDEDMFKALKSKGITIRTGHARSSHADFYLKQPRDVRRFLKRIA